MNFHVMTLFPEMIDQALQTSILGRAIKNGCIRVNAVNIRDYTKDKHKKVDDYPYGGGAGMLMQAQPVYDCFRAVRAGVAARQGEAAADGMRVICLTPQGRTFSQEMAMELAEEEELVFLCGHYEGIDERVLEEIVTDYISIGDYVLTGGELPSLVIMDAVARLVPGVLHNGASACFETFHNDLLEYPQYSRPEEWQGKRVPEVLLSGDHRRVEAWRLEQSQERTRKLRPDLFEKYRKKQSLIRDLLKRNRALYIDMAESLRRGRGEVIYEGEEGVIVADRQAGVCMLAAFSDQAAGGLVSLVSAEPEFRQFVLHQECLLAPLEEHCLIESNIPCRHAVYHHRIAPALSKKVEIRRLDPSFLGQIVNFYHTTSAEYIRERLVKGRLFGAFAEGSLAGFGGEHQEGSLGMLYVYEGYRRQGIGLALVSYLIGLHMSEGLVPYGHVAIGNSASQSLNRKLGLKISKETLYWVRGSRRQEF